MSKPADNASASPDQAFKALEGAVKQLLGTVDDLTARVEAAEQKSAELNETMQKYAGAPEAAGEVLTRLQALEAENEDLRQRLAQGREGIDRVLARVRFVENQG